MTATLSSPLPRVLVTDPPVKLPDGLSLPGQYARRGAAFFRETIISTHAAPEFRRLWVQHKLGWLMRGFAMRRQNGGKWSLQQWLAGEPGAYTLTAIGAEKVAQAMNPPANSLPIAEVAPAPAPPPDLPPLPYGLEEKLYDYQRQPARQLFRALTHGGAEWQFNGAIDASEMGLGKTIEGLAAALATGLEIGVICKLSNVPDWVDAFKFFGRIPPLFVKNYDSLRTGKGPEVVLEKYTDEHGRQKKRFTWTASPEDTCLIFDEVHSCRNAGTLQQGLLMAAARQKFTVLGISGTVMENPTHLRAVGRILGLHTGGKDWHRFLSEHGCSPVSPGSKEWKFCGGGRGAAILSRLGATVFPMRGARTRKKDLGSRFPSKQVILRPCRSKAIDEVIAEYKAAEATIDALEKQHAKDLSFQRKSIYTKVRHKSEFAKLDTIEELCREALTEGMHVALFVNFDDVRRELMRRFKTTCGIYGDQSSRPGERQRCIKAFLDDEEPVIVINNAAGGTGVNLPDIHGNHPRYSIICPNDNATEILQVIDRTHRANSVTPAVNVILYAEGTIEERICRNITRKEAQIMAFNDATATPETVLAKI